MPPSDDDAKLRAVQLRQRITAAGLTLVEFGRRAGFTRNVVLILTRFRGGVGVGHQAAALLRRS